MLKRLRRPAKNEKGIATVEMVPLLVLFMMLLNFTIGFFGVIHSGVLNSIAARNYAFETFRNRTSLNYLRDIGDGGLNLNSNYTKFNYRFHGIISEGSGMLTWVATRRPIKFTDHRKFLRPSDTGQGTKQDHETLVRRVQGTGKVSEVFSGDTPDDGQSGVDPIWVQTLYGMCLNSKCAP